MTDQQPEWTSDHLLAPGGMHHYCEALRRDFREMRTEFRSLARELYGDLVAAPMPEDAAWQARMHAQRVTKPLRDMERSAQRIVTLARRLEARYESTYIELPKSRAEKARAKRRRDARRTELAARPAAPALREAPAARRDDPAKEPVFELFPSKAKAK